MNMEYFFESVIGPYIAKKGYGELCEIGASLGGNTDKLLKINSATLTVIDPCLDTDLIAKYKDDKNIRIHRGKSLDVLPKLSQAFDCILIDGDHNWYTVYNELKNIEAKGLLRDGGTIFFHDVWWPYGRRDLYYVPEEIPESSRHPYAKKGIVKGRSELSEDSGINSYLYNAANEGGPRNGVLTAIEDFLKNAKEEYYFFYIKHDVGLGVLIKTGNKLKALFTELSLRMRMFYFKMRKKILKKLNKK